jgi:hypothetical protein
MLGSSGVERASENPLKNVCKKLTHVHKAVLHLVVLVYLQRVGRKKQGDVFCRRHTPCVDGLTLRVGRSDTMRRQRSIGPYT